MPDTSPAQLRSPPGATPIHAGDGTTGRWRARHVWIVLVAGLLLTLFALPLDGSISHAVLRGVDAAAGEPKLVPRVGGDVKRELEFLQQFGAISCLIITGLVVLLVDRERGWRLADMGIASLLVGIACNVLKLSIGRPRPRFDDPGTFLFPRGTYQLTIQGERVVRHAWESGRGMSSELWSMPSSHTAAGVALAVFLCAVYPKLKPLAIGLAVVVPVARIVLGAHYLSDVIAGAVVGYAVSSPVVHARIGERLIRRLTGHPAPSRLNS